MLQAAHPNEGQDAWLVRGIAMAAITGVCLIHAFTPRLGIWMSNVLGAFKLILLTLVVCTGVAALSGKMAGKSPPPRNFSSFHGPEWPDRKSEGGSDAIEGAAGYALALLQVTTVLYVKLIMSNTETGAICIQWMGER